MKSLLLILFPFFSSTYLNAQQIILNGPVGSNQFGSKITVLTNGNYVITDIGYSEPGKDLCGAVYLYDGSTHTLISTLKGNRANDAIGSSGVFALPNGNFVVCSPICSNGSLFQAGAVTWCNGTTGLSGVVDLSNSLMGSSFIDLVGNFGITILPSGNYVVNAPDWNNGPVTDAGAVTWCNGNGGTVGVISSSNSLVGSSNGDRVGGVGSIRVLPNGNYLVLSPGWDNGAIPSVGAVTWCNGLSGRSGAVSSSNSLIGASANELLGSGNITVVPSGNYIVGSPNWNNGANTSAGAVTWCDGNGSTVGVVSSSNSLVGSTTGDRVGDRVDLLSNGNYVVKSRNWDNGASTDAGAVTWVNGTTGITGVVSSSNSLVGSTTGDRVGDRVDLLSNGNYLVISPQWDNGAIANAGAVTWCNGTTGITGVISSSNSLVGSSANDQVGSGVGSVGGVVILPNGNYLVMSPNWDNGANTDAGAVTWCNSTTGIMGAVSSSNSLVGGGSGNMVGSGGITPLSNGNYIVGSPNWNNGANTSAGAVTWCNGTTSTTGVVSSSNSLVGSSVNDQVGFGGIVILNNGNCVVSSPSWDNGAIANAGAVTWINGTTGITGVISSSNSLVGSTRNDGVGNRVDFLSNGNYVVTSRDWDNGAIGDVGAVTWCNGTTGTTGVVSSTNSLVGSRSFDQVGSGGITVLTNGNYVVRSSLWDNGGIIDAGAVTWVNGTTGISGVVSSANSLVGSTDGDQVGSSGITVLPNGNFVVSSFLWDNGAIPNASAVTWGDGTTGTTGVVSSSNSLVGSKFNDQLGSGGITVLANGNFVVSSTSWDNGSNVDAGAVTWCNGTTGTTGVVNSGNSLVGSKFNDQLGSGGITVLANGNFVVSSVSWDNGSNVDAGAVTWVNGTTGITGVVSSANSLVGSTDGDQVGSTGITVLANGNFVVSSASWDNGSNVNAGAVTWGNSSTLLSGTVNSCNSVTGLVTGSINSSFNSIYGYLLVGVPASNRLVIYNPTGQTLANHLDVVSTSINGSNEVPFVTNPSCRIIGTLTSNGASPVRGTVNAKIWIESGVPSVAGQPFVARHFEMTPATSPGTATGRVTLYFTQQEFTDFNNDPGSLLDLPTGPTDAAGKANLRIEKRSGTSSNGTGLPNTYSGSITTIDPADADIVWNVTLSRWEVSFDVTGFSGFFVKTTLTVLPLTLLEFNGRLQNGNALLNWKTENEVNTDQFLVERSTDGRIFATVAMVDAKNQPGINWYNHIDAGVHALAASIVYYRLKQTDIDSRFTYSRIIALPLGKQNNLMLYPNPATDQLMITVSTERAEKVQIRIVDNAGRILRQQYWNSTAGGVTMQFEVSSLAKGMYYLEVKGETTIQRKSFVKL